MMSRENSRGTPSAILAVKIWDGVHPDSYSFDFKERVQPHNS